MNSEDKRIIYTGVVTDNLDPLRLGRIIVDPQSFAISTKKFSTEYDGNVDLEGKDKWDISVNPFLFRPLIPNLFTMIPKVGDMVNIIFSNPDRDFVDGFYIPSSVIDRGFNDSTSAEHKLSQSREGLQYKKGKDLVKENGKYVKEKYNGAIPKVDDFAISSRVNSDVIWSDNAVVIRAGKVDDEISTKLNEPIRDDNPAILQVSKFDKTFTYKEGDEQPVETTRFTHLEVLIEYYIESLTPVNGNYTGTIYVYRPLKKDGQTETIYFNNLTVLDEKELLYTKQIFEPSLDDLGMSIRHAIKGIINTGKSGVDALDGFIKHPSNQDPAKMTSIYPLYLRPVRQQYNDLITNTDYSGFIDKIRIKSRKSYGLVYSLDEDETPKKVTYIRPTNIIKDDKPSKNIISVSDNNFLIAYGNNVPENSEGIDFSKVSNYKITQDELLTSIYPNTYSLVRGEELQELLDVMYLFMVSHVHNPAESGVVQPAIKAKLEDKFQNFKQNILSQKNRIN